MAVLDTTATEPKLQLNPGPGYIMKGSDYCFYMSLGREECMKIAPVSKPEAGRKNSETREKQTGGWKEKTQKKKLILFLYMPYSKN